MIAHFIISSSKWQIDKASLYEQKVYVYIGWETSEMEIFYDEKKKALSCLLVPLLSANLLLSAGSRTADEPVTKSGFYFNTVISVSIYEKGSEELLDVTVLPAQKYEGYFSNTFRTAIS